MATDLVLIDKKELAELKRARDMLQALENAGVDSWDGYEEAQEGSE